MNRVIRLYGGLINEEIAVTGKPDGGYFWKKAAQELQ